MSASTSTTRANAVPAQPRCTSHCRALTMRFQRRLLAGALVLVLAIPGTANSFTIDQLLDMPIEELLRLEITSPHPPRVAVRWPASANELPDAEQRDAT